MDTAKNLEFRWSRAPLVFDRENIVAFYAFARIGADVSSLPVVVPVPLTVYSKKKNRRRHTVSSERPAVDVVSKSGNGDERYPNYTRTTTVITD